ncbi:MAG: flagellar basal body-associated FliL family protein [Sedimenticola sp.]
MADEEKKEDLELGEEEKGSNTKLIIMIAVGVIVLLGGGLGLGWFLFGGGGGDEAGEGEEVVEEVVLPAIYHPVTPEFVVNLPPGGKVKMLQVEMQVVTRNQETVTFIKENDPMIRHNLLDLFGSQDGDKLKSRESKEALQGEVVKILNKIIKEQEGPGEVETVYFTAFVTQ